MRFLLRRVGFVKLKIDRRKNDNNDVGDLSLNAMG
jgi:hypothetical protein